VEGTVISFMDGKPTEQTQLYLVLPGAIGFEPWIKPQDSCVEDLKKVVYQA